MGWDRSAARFSTWDSTWWSGSQKTLPTTRRAGPCSLNKSLRRTRPSYEPRCLRGLNLLTRRRTRSRCTGTRLCTRSGELPHTSGCTAGFPIRWDRTRGPPRTPLLPRCTRWTCTRCGLPQTPRPREDPAPWESDPHAFDHLIHHSDAEGFYAPVDFAPVLQDRTVVGALVGSAPQLLAECHELALALGIDPGADPESEDVYNAVDGNVEDPRGWESYAVETYTCLQLIRAAQASLQTGAAVVFA